MKEFDWTRVTPRPLLEGLTDLRVHDPERISRASRQRRRRPFVTLSGRLSLVSARGEDAHGVARDELLGRLVSAISSDWCDGIVAPVPVLEDLIALHDIVLEGGTPGCLEHKLLIADCLRQQGYWAGGSPASCEEYRLDAAYLRVAAGTPLAEVFPAMDALAKQAVRTIVEATPAGIASLDMARFSWIALPSADFAASLALTSLPVLLAPDPGSDAAQNLKAMEAALCAAPNARGVLCGPSLWRGPGLHPRKVVEIAGRMVHDKLSLHAAVEAVHQEQHPQPA